MGVRATAPAAFFGRRFYLTERIGTGARGEVFLAEQESAGGFRRRVALKLLRSNLPPKETGEAARRMRERARVLGRLSHRSIVQVLDLVLIGGDWAVVMEPVPGPDLERVLGALVVAGRLMPARSAFEVAAAIADALDAAWHTDDGQGTALRLVHGDIHPSNVLLTRDGDVKVLGFGVGLFGEADGARYPAPERLHGHPPTPANDVYALAATLVELVMGEPTGQSLSDPSRHADVVDHAVEALRTRLVGDPVTIGDAVALIRSALDADPAQRPTARRFGDTCAALAPRLAAEGLRPFARTFAPRVDGLLGRPVALTSGVLTELTATIDPSPGPAPVPVASRPPPPPRPSSLSWLTVAVGMIVASGGTATLVAIAAVAVDLYLEEAVPRVESVGVQEVAVAPPVALDPSVGRLLPPRYEAVDDAALRLALRSIEAHLVMAGAEKPQVVDVTGAFEREVLRTAIPSVPLDIYPRPMFDLLAGEIQRGASPSEMSARLVDAHLDGRLRDESRER